MAMATQAVSRFKEVRLPSYQTKQLPGKMKDLQKSDSRVTVIHWNLRTVEMVYTHVLEELLRMECPNRCQARQRYSKCRVQRCFGAQGQSLQLS